MTKMEALFCICVSGFTQSRGSYHGILKLREQLIKEGFSEGVANRVWYLPWISNWGSIAADLSSVCNVHGLKPHVLLSGYSYGGWGAIQLAKKLETSAIDVESLILCDPVARPWYWPRPLPAVTSLTGRMFSPSLHIPGNVRRVIEYHQTENRPQGHRLKLEQGTIREKPIRLRYRHSMMDDSREYHGRVIKEAKRLKEGLRG